MAKKNRGKGKGAQNRPESTSDLLQDVREILLTMLLMQVCRACSGTGRAHVDNEPGTGRPVFGRCECRNQAAELVKDFGLEVPGDEGEGAGDPEEADADHEGVGDFAP